MNGSLSHEAIYPSETDIWLTAWLCWHDRQFRQLSIYNSGGGGAPSIGLSPSIWSECISPVLADDIGRTLLVTRTKYLFYFYFNYKLYGDFWKHLFLEKSNLQAGPHFKILNCSNGKFLWPLTNLKGTVSRDVRPYLCCSKAGLGKCSFQKNAKFLCSFAFFIKERFVLCVLLHSL